MEIVNYQSRQTKIFLRKGKKFQTLKEICIKKLVALDLYWALLRPL